MRMEITGFSYLQNMRTDTLGKEYINIIMVPSILLSTLDVLLSCSPQSGHEKHFCPSPPKETPYQLAIPGIL